MLNGILIVNPSLLLAEGVSIQHVSTCLFLHGNIRARTCKKVMLVSKKNCCSGFLVKRLSLVHVTISLIGAIFSCGL